jgi:shikimate dehydrogenase
VYLLGHPVERSLSPAMHNAAFRALGLPHSYETLDVTADALPAAVARIRSGEVLGANVTVPYKEAVMTLVDTWDGPTAEIGAANTLSRTADGKIIASNTDAVGFEYATRALALDGARVLLLGAGGAARGAMLPILETRPARLTIVNRTRSKADALQCQFARFGEVDVKNGVEVGSSSFDVVLNATSASMRGELPEFAASAVASGSLAYEFAYGKGLTPFLGFARSAGAVTLADGVGMLVEQAAEAFAWWRGTRPDTSRLIVDLAIPLQ